MLTKVAIWYRLKRQVAAGINTRPHWFLQFLEVKERQSNRVSLSREQRNTILLEVFIFRRSEKQKWVDMTRGLQSGGIRLHV